VLGGKSEEKALNPAPFFVPVIAKQALLNLTVCHCYFIEGAEASTQAFEASI
jgi:hypothetical protein